MKENEINLQSLYNLTRVLLNNKANKEVWVSGRVMEIFIPILEKAMKQGAKIIFNKKDEPPNEKSCMVAGYIFIEKLNIEGIMCFGSESFVLNEKDASIEEFLSLLNYDGTPNLK